MRSARAYLPLVAAFLLTLLGGASALASSYALTDLGTLHGGSSGALSVNENGQIVGYADSPTGFPPHAAAFRTGSEGNVDLGSLPGLAYSTAQSVSNNGEIVGVASTGSGSDTNRAVLFDETGAGNNTYIGPPGGVDSAAYSINTSGLIVGYARHDGVRRATRFDSSGGGTPVDLGSANEGFSFALATNEVGAIVGRASLSPSTYVATVFDPSGQGNNLYLGTLGGPYSAAEAINNLGDIVGFASDSTSMLPRATLFDPTGAGNNVKLSGNHSYAFDINNSGQIVGTVYSGAEPGATLFDPSGQGNNTYLNDVIDSNLGWNLWRAYSINDDGWIVGYGTVNGVSHAFLLTPVPEPSTATLFTIGLIGLLKRRRSGPRKSFNRFGVA